MKLQDKLMLIDGNSILNRAFYGLMGPKMLATSEGFYTNAIYGFLNILVKFMNEDKPSHLVIAFDMKKPTFRHTQYANYKANRKGMPKELADQMPVVKEILDAMNIKRVEIEGYEADDIIGTLSRHSDEAGLNAIIITGDKDSLQLVNKNVNVKIPTTRMGKTETDKYDVQEITKKYGVTPKQLIEVKALMGDSSDNIPGVPGIGEKTALDMIQKYTSVENIYANVESLNIKERVKNLLIEHKQLADMSRELATIKLDVPIDFAVKECKIIEYNYPELLNILKKYEFSSLIAKLGLENKHSNNTEEENFSFEYNCIANVEELKEVIDFINKSGEFAYFLVLDKKNNLQADVIGISICWEQDKTAYFHLKDQKIGFKLIKEIFENKDVKKYTFNAKSHYLIFDTLKIDLELVDFDIMIAAYLANPAKEIYSLSDLSKEFLNISITNSNELLKYKNDDYDQSSISDIAKIACEQSVAIFKLTKVLKEKIIEDGQKKLYFEIELPLTRVLADMEKEGIMVNVGELDQLSFALHEKIEGLTSEILDIAGEKFNINSTKQLGIILFEKLKLPVVRKTKTGYSTDAEVLEKLAPEHHIIERIVEYRQLVKLKSTYADGLKLMIEPHNNRIHSTFNQTVTVTGRISSTEPNLQNIPIKLEMGKQIRKVFVASEGCLFLDADYSQIELRVLAHIADDRNMIDAFKHDLDIHRITAAQVFNVKEEEVTSLMRSRAKAINFGIVYGIGDFSLAKDLKITRKQAKNYIDNYLEKYCGVRNYMHEIVGKGKHEGYVSTLLGRRRYLPELHSSNFNIRSFGERIAMNTPIQGTAADIIKVAMVRVHGELKRRKLQSKLILQVHDELIIETQKDEMDEVKNILKCCMEGAIELVVPLEVDIHSGCNWYDAK